MKKIFAIITLLFLFFCFGLTSNTVTVDAASTDIVGQVSIFASKAAGSGHSFLMFKNTSDETYLVGHYYLEPNKTVTVGTWGNKDDGKGVYYNLEAYFINVYGSYSDRVSITMSYTQSQLETLTQYINSNNSWTLLFNCASFTERVWNSVATGSLKVNAGFLIKTPTALYNNIVKKSGYVTRKAVPAVTDTNVRRHTASSSSSVSSGSLSSSSSS
jgi:hypothetical protein